jgi:hypothetical protein
VESCELQGEPHVYPRDELADYIDGDVESFYPYGVGSTVAVTYSDGAGGKVELDIYDMLTPLGAFGIYAHRRPDDEKPIKLGTRGWAEGRQVVCFAGRYYVVLRAVSRGPKGLEKARQLAEKVAVAVPGPHEMPADLGLLPEEHRVPSSERWHPSSYLGLPGMPAVFAAHYAVTGEGAEPGQLAFSRAYPSTEDAQAAYDKLLEALRGRAVPDSGFEAQVDLAGTSMTVQGMEVKYRGVVLAARFERRLLLTVGVPRGPAAELLARIADRIANAEKPPGDAEVEG